MKLGKLVKIMRENKHFKEFFIHHENSLEKGLEKLDQDAMHQVARRRK